MQATTAPSPTGGATIPGGPDLPRAARAVDEANAPTPPTAPLQNTTI